MNKSVITFVLKCTLVYAVAYLVVGGLAYQFVTKQFYVGENPIFSEFLRSESNAVEWAHVNRWMIPILLLRGVLISAVLLPFIETLKQMRPVKRIGILFVMMFVLIHFAAAAPSPSNLEGLVYMKPQFVGITPFLLTQPEMIFQCLLFAFGLSWIVQKHQI